MSVDNYERIVQNLKKSRIPGAVKQVVNLMLDKKADRIVALKLKGTNRITNYMVICNGNSLRQNHAISEEIQRKLRKEARLKPYSVEGRENADWILMDYIDFIVHIFSPETRAKYLIEKLWMDAKRYNFFND